MTLIKRITCCLTACIMLAAVAGCSDKAEEEPEKSYDLTPSQPSAETTDKPEQSGEGEQSSEEDEPSSGVLPWDYGIIPEDVGKPAELADTVESNEYGGKMTIADLPYSKFKSFYNSLIEHWSGRISFGNTGSRTVITMKYVFKTDEGNKTEYLLFTYTPDGEVNFTAERTGLLDCKTARQALGSLNFDVYQREIPKVDKDNQPVYDENGVQVTQKVNQQCFEYYYEDNVLKGMKIKLVIPEKVREYDRQLNESGREGMYVRLICAVNSTDKTPDSYKYIAESYQEGYWVWSKPISELDGEFTVEFPPEVLKDMYKITPFLLCSDCGDNEALPGSLTEIPYFKVINTSLSTFSFQ